jgi:hypothetical protein
MEFKMTKISLLLTLIPFLLIACGQQGGSSKSNKGGDKPVCAVGEKCTGPLNPRKPQNLNRPISKDQAIEILSKNIENFEDIKIGMSFLEVRRCRVDSRQDEIINKLTVLKYNKDYRTVEYLVEMLSKPQEKNCLFDDSDNGKKYVLIRSLPELSDAVSDLGSCKNFYHTKLGADPFILCVGEAKDSDGWSSKLEVGINLNKAYPLAIYVENKAFFKNKLVMFFQEFINDLGIVDTTGIDTTGLDVVYEASARSAN